MRAVFVVMLAAACSGGGGGGSTIDDARSVDSRPWTPPCPMAPSPLCSTTCGNNLLDSCYRPDTSHDSCFTYFKVTEECDGVHKPTCESRGYYGGTGTCHPTLCFFTTTGCLACASGPQIVECETFTEVTTAIALRPSADDSRVVLATEFGARVIDVASQGLTVSSTQSITTGIGDLATTPSGWLVASFGPTPTVRTLAVDGTLGPLKSLSTEDPHSGAIAYGAGNRALVAWTKWDGLAQQSTVSIAIVDSAGDTVVAPTQLLSAVQLTSPEYLLAISDGTSFFLTTTRDNVLRRIGTDGSLLSATTGVQPPTRYITRSGSTSWYLHVSGSTLTAQRFDGAGALVGDPVQATTTSGIKTVIARPSDFVAVLATPTGATNTYRFDVVRIATDGTVGTPVEIGVGDSGPVLAAIGTRVVATWWTAGVRHVSLIDPL